MDSVLGIIYSLIIFFVAFLFIPATYGRYGGYAELVKFYKHKRLNEFTLKNVNISVERGIGLGGAWSHVNVYINENAFYIFPSFKLWAFAFPSIKIPRSEVNVKIIKKWGLFKYTQISFNNANLPKITLPFKCYQYFQ